MLVICTMLCANLISVGASSYYHSVMNYIYTRTYHEYISPVVCVVCIYIN